MYSLPIAFKAASLESSGFFAGHVATFNTPDLTGDIVLPGSFAASIAQHKARGILPPLLWSHDSGAPIGRLTTLKEDQTGLYAEAQLTLEVRAAAEAYALLQAGAISGLSFGYSIAANGAEYRGDNRLLKQIDLHEVSVVSVPAHPDSRITAVKSAMACTHPRDLEHLLRESLFLSSRKAKAASNLLWPLLNERDAQDDERDARKSAAPGELAAFARELDLITKSLQGN
ncbi:MAG: HK97 family phage prohead protease [Sterolibacterium sp.]|jgi:hypothetical protein